MTTVPARTAPDLRWVPVGLAAVAEGAWISVLAGLAQDYALQPPTLPLGAFVAVVALGAVAARRLGPRLGPRWPLAGTLLVLATGAAGPAVAGAGGLLAQGPAGLPAAWARDPGALLAGLALLRGYGLAHVPVDDGRMGRLFTFGIAVLCLAAALGGPVVPPYGPRFLADAGAASLVFALTALAALSLARLGGVGGGVATAWAGNPAWLATFGALAAGALAIAALWGGGFGAAIELAAGLAVGPLLILGLFAGFDRRTARLLLVTVGLAAVIIVILPLLATPPEASTVTPGIPPGAPDPGLAASRPVLVVGAGALAIAVVAAILVLVRLAMRETVGDDDAELDTRTIDRGPERPAAGAAARTRRGAPHDAVGAYLALLADLHPRAGVARLPGETPAEHARRLRSDGRGALGLELLAADYALARFAGRPLTGAEDRRAVARWRRLRGRIRGPVVPPPGSDRKARPAPDQDLTIHALGLDEFPSLSRAPEERQK